MSNGDRHIVSSVFDSFGILEQLLFYLPPEDLLRASCVNKRWKSAARRDSLWAAAAKLLWRDKIGVGMEHSIFWRTLLTNDAIQRMNEDQVRSVFEHPLLSEKKERMESVCKDGLELRRFYRVHMLDVMSGISDCSHRFFSDVQFGSFASSLIDSKRDLIMQSEICTPFGFDMFFKIARDDVDVDDQELLTTYEDAEDILLYHHSTCFFEPSYDFHIVLNQEMENYHPTNLSWTWLDLGRRLQVGPYPPLTVSRTKNWGWKLENLHVILLFRDSPPILAYD